jgi:S1-C subfamily serine protease
MGVMPDYAFEGKGMRIDGVSDGKPAAKAGLKQGDVVIGLGDDIVTDVMSYMKTLSKFKKGDTAKVRVMRGKDELEMKVTF